MYIKYIIYNYFLLKYGKLRQLAINCDNILRRVSSPENMKGLVICTLEPVHIKLLQFDNKYVIINA